METAPILSKLLSPVGPYDHLIQNREYPFKIAYMGHIQENKTPEGLKSVPKTIENTSFRKEQENRSQGKMINEDAAIQLAQLQEKLVKQLLNKKNKNV